MQIGLVWQRTQEFVRWMRASCMESPPVPQGPGQTPFIYSFYLEIGRIPRMLQLFLKIQENIQTILSDIWTHLKKFRKFKNLIRFSKERTVKEFASVHPPVDSYDEKLGFYSQIEKRINEITNYKIFGCIKLHMQPLMSAICKHAREWVFKLGAALLASSRELIREFDLIVSEYDRDVHVLPKNVDEMKHIFLTIQAIKDATIYVEGLYRDLLKRYDVLKLYEIEFPQQDVDRLQEIWYRWQKLWLHEIKVVDKQMQPLKMKFTKITKDEGGVYHELVKAFAKSYYSEGPGSVDADLDRGVDLLEEFREKYKIMEQKRVEMTNNEKVFGLEVSLYPQLLEVLKDMDTISVLFGIYQNQKEARASWGQVLWTELNAQFLTDGIEYYLQELRKLPKSVRSSEVGKQLEATMKEFRRSIPVFMDLRNESMRDRVTIHEKNGVRFDFDPDRLTPGDLFLMEIRFVEEPLS